MSDAGSKKRLPSDAPALNASHGSQGAKKARNSPSTPRLPPEVLNKIALFMSDPRQIVALFKASSCDVALFKSPEAIVRAAVFHGGRTKNVISHLVKLLEHKAIHVPSRARLIDLITSQTCERSNRCCGYNLQTKQAYNVTKFSEVPFGLGICEPCMKASYSICILTFDDVTKYPFLSTWAWRLKNSHEHVLDPRTQQLKQIGPTICHWQVQQILSTFPRGSVEFENAMNQLREENLPTDDDEHGERIIQVYQQAANQYDAFVENRDELAKAAMDAKRAFKEGCNKRNSECVKAKIAALLKDNPHRDLILKGSLDEKGYYRLESGPAQHLFGGILSAPTTKLASIKHISQVCDRAAHVYALLNENGLLVPDSPFPFRSDSPHERALFDWSLSKRNEGKLLVSADPSTDRDFEGFIEALKGRKCSTALLRIMNQSDRAIAFAQYVSREERNAPTTESYRLAKAVMEAKGSSARQIGPWGVTFNNRQKQYCILMQKFRKYLEHGPTTQFLQQQPAAHPQHQDITRPVVVNSALDLPSNQRKLLEEEKFPELLDLHQRCFDAGRIITGG